MNQLSALEPAEPIRRYERENPGELIHIDIKKLGRIGSVGHRITGRQPGVVNRHLGIGWEYVHVCIDHASRVAFVQVMANQRKESAVAFLDAAVAYYAQLGIRIERVMTDNGSCYRSKTFRAACKRLGLRQVLTQPYTPRTNGKAERFIQTALREWAYARAYENPGNDLPSYSTGCIVTIGIARHASCLKAKTPISRLGFSEDNLFEAPQLAQKLRITIRLVQPLSGGRDRVSGGRQADFLDRKKARPGRIKGISFDFKLSRLAGGAMV